MVYNFILDVSLRAFQILNPFSLSDTKADKVVLGPRARLGARGADKVEQGQARPIQCDLQLHAYAFFPGCHIWQNSRDFEKSDVPR